MRTRYVSLLGTVSMLLFTGMAHAQQLEIGWLPGECAGYCTPTAGYNVYINAEKINVNGGTPDSSVPNGLKATINLSAIPTTDIRVSMSSYDSAQTESIKSNEIVVAAGDWLQPTPVPTLQRAKPIVVRIQ